MTQAEYLQVLAEFETLLRRHMDVEGQLLPIDPHVQDLRDAWERTATFLRHEYPELDPVPFWEGAGRMQSEGSLRATVLFLLGLNPTPHRGRGLAHP